MEQECNKCRQILPMDQFPQSGGRIRMRCRSCAAKHTRDYNRARRAHCLALVAGNQRIACKWCGYDQDDRALCFDHVNDDGYLDRKTASGKNYLWKLIQADPSRFQILCANCNQIKAIQLIEGRY